MPLLLPSPIVSSLSTGSTRLRCMSPLKHRLRRLTPRSSFLAILMLCGVGFVATTLLVYSGSRAEVKAR